MIRRFALCFLWCAFVAGSLVNAVAQDAPTSPTLTESFVDYRGNLIIVERYLGLQSLQGAITPTKGYRSRVIVVLAGTQTLVTNEVVGLVESTVVGRRAMYAVLAVPSVSTDGKVTAITRSLVALDVGPTGNIASTLPSLSVERRIAVKVVQAASDTDRDTVYLTEHRKVGTSSTLKGHVKIVRSDGARFEVVNELALP